MNKGIFYLILASIGYALMGVFIRLINPEIPPFTQNFLRYILTVLLSLLFVYKNKHTLKPKNIFDFCLLISIGIIGYTLNTIFFTFSILYTTLATTLFLFSTNIIFTSFLSALILKEKITTKQLIAIALSLAGSLFLFKPDISSLNFYGALFALLASVSVSIYYVGRRKLKKYPSTVIMAYSTISGLITMGIASLVLETSFYSSNTNFNIGNISSFIWIVTIVYALDNFLAWVFVNKGFQLVPAGIGSVILLLEPILGTLLGLLLYQETLSNITLLGIALILSGIIFVTRRD